MTKRRWRRTNQAAPVRKRRKKIQSQRLKQVLCGSYFRLCGRVVSVNHVQSQRMYWLSIRLLIEFNSVSSLYHNMFGKRRIEGVLSIILVVKHHQWPFFLEYIFFTTCSVNCFQQFLFVDSKISLSHFSTPPDKSKPAASVSNSTTPTPTSITVSSPTTPTNQVTTPTSPVKKVRSGSICHLTLADSYHKQTKKFQHSLIGFKRPQKKLNAIPVL